MKKLFLLLTVASWLLTSCSPSVFMQIATLSSDNVNLQKSGSFAYEDTLITIEYDFWSETGKFSFLVTNNSDNDIYLNLVESYFVNNGYAYDYYQARTYTYTSRNLASSKSSSSAYIADHAGLTTVRYTKNPGGINTSGTLATSKGYQASSSYTVAAENGLSIEYKEKTVICIPAHSSKAFEEFNVSTSVFRDCGFIRDPYKEEIAVREFTNLSSPRVIENRLMFEMGNITIPVTNTFYVSHYQNIYYRDATEYVQVENCDGTKTRVLVNKMSAKNKFYITYSGNDLNMPSKSANDRTSNKKMSFGNTNSQGLNDDIYNR